jgi:hypothetical protein
MKGDTMLSLELRLLIMLPTMFFLYGLCFKLSLLIRFQDKLEVDFKYRSGLRTIIEDNFFALFTIDSLFLLIANGLILFFHVKVAGIGIIVIVIGSILIMSLFFGLYLEINELMWVAFILILFILGAEVTYFGIVGLIHPIIDIIGSFIGGGIILFVILYVVDELRFFS